MQVGTCSALTGLCTCPAGWTGFNCLHPMKRHCTHRHRRFGFEVPRLQPDPSLGVAGSEADWRFTRSHCSGGSAACGLWGSSKTSWVAGCKAGACSPPPALPADAAYIRACGHTVLPTTSLSLQATAMRTLLPASAPPTQPLAASQRRWMPCKARPWPGCGQMICDLLAGLPCLQAALLSYALHLLGALLPACLPACPPACHSLTS
jgi:hypothetical protein